MWIQGEFRTGREQVNEKEEAVSRVVDRGKL